MVPRVTNTLQTILARKPAKPPAWPFPARLLEYPSLPPAHRAQRQAAPSPSPSAEPALF